jgi:hypothetical protein
LAARAFWLRGRFGCAGVLAARAFWLRGRFGCAGVLAARALRVFRFVLTLRHQKFVSFVVGAPP